MGLFGPSFMKVWNQGAPAPGVLVGIRRFEVSEDESTIEIVEYAIDLGGEVVGVRQRLSPREEVRLGMPVTVHRIGKDAVIRWGAPIETRWKMVKPPPPGIEDKVDGPPRGSWTPGDLEVLEVGSRSGMLGFTSVAQAKVRFTGPGSPVEALVDKYVPPFYASHLGAAGSRLPGLQHPRDPMRIRVDWPAAAVATPGVGVQPVVGASPDGAHPGFGTPGLLDRLQSKVAASTGAAMGFDMNAGPGAEDPVSWEMFLAASVAIRDEPATPPDEVARRHGVPAGEWEAANKRWMGRIMSDWKLGAAYGQALG
jgi:hypothetical protein